MDWIKPYLQDENLIRLQQSVDLVQKNEHYRSWIGLNFSKNGLYSVKFYYTFYQLLNESELSKLFVLGNNAEFFKAYKHVSINNVLDVNEAGSGFTFSVKLDKELKPTLGFYFKIVFNDDDDFFLLPETKEFFKQNGNIFNLDLVKNYSVFYDGAGNMKIKSYYYIKDSIFKKIIANWFDEPYLADAPVIEYAVGEGCRAFSEVDLAKRKAIVFGDFKKFSEIYLHRWSKFKPYFDDMQNMGYQLYCPAIYGDKEFFSIYAFDFENNSKLIENLFSDSNVNIKK